MMKFPNAYKGVKKLWLAELLAILIAVLTVAVVAVLANAGIVQSALVGAESVTDAQSAAVLTAGGLTLAVGLVAIVSFILSLVGVIQAKRDEDNFKTALIFVLLGIVLSAIGSAMDSNGVTGKYFSVASEVCNGFVNYFVLVGISVLAGKLGSEALKASAQKASWIVCAAVICSEVVQVITMNMTNASLVLGLAIAASVIKLVAYVYYLIVLSRARTLLKC